MTIANSSDHASPLLFLTSGSEEVLEYKFRAPPLSCRGLWNRRRMTILENERRRWWRRWGMREGGSLQRYSYDDVILFTPPTQYILFIHLHHPYQVHA